MKKRKMKVMCLSNKTHTEIYISQDALCVKFTIISPRSRENNCRNKSNHPKSTRDDESEKRIVIVVVVVRPRIA